MSTNVTAQQTAAWRVPRLSDRQTRWPGGQTEWQVICQDNIIWTSDWQRLSERLLRKTQHDWQMKRPAYRPLFSLGCNEDFFFFTEICQIIQTSIVPVPCPSTFPPIIDLFPPCLCLQSTSVHWASHGLSGGWNREWWSDDIAINWFHFHTAGSFPLGDLADRGDRLIPREEMSTSLQEWDWKANLDEMACLSLNLIGGDQCGLLRRKSNVHMCGLSFPVFHTLTPSKQLSQFSLQPSLHFTLHLPHSEASSFCCWIQ